VRCRQPSIHPGLNINFEGTKSRFSEIQAKDDLLTLETKQGVPRADMDGTETRFHPDPKSPDWARTSLGGNYSSVASIFADREMLVGSGKAVLEREQGYRSTGMPGWLNQADILQVVGPAISARSDTFRIRTAGQSLDLAGNVKSAAYLEAIVQRTPEFVDVTDDAHAQQADLISEANQTYGRRFKIVSVRWLSPDEI